MIYQACTSSNLFGQILDFAKERFGDFDMSFRGIGQSINPMKAAGQGGLLPARLHRFDELPPVYS